MSNDAYNLTYKKWSELTLTDETINTGTAEVLITDNGVPKRITLADFRTLLG